MFKIIKQQKHASGAIENEGGVIEETKLFQKCSTGWYYRGQVNRTRKLNHHKFDFSSKWFLQPFGQQYNDCVIHSLNYAVGYAYFRSREQTVSMMKYEMKASQLKVINFKMISGISLAYLKRVVTDGNEVYGLRILNEWESNPLETRFSTMIKTLDQLENQVFIVIYSVAGAVASYSHAITIKKCQEKYAVYDSQRSTIQYLSPRNQSQATWDISELLNDARRVEIWGLYIHEFESQKKKQLEIDKLECMIKGEKRQFKRVTSIASKKKQKSKAKKWSHKKKKQ